MMLDRIFRTVALFVALALTALGAFTLGRHWGTEVSLPMLEMLRIGAITVALTALWAAAVTVAAGWRVPRLRRTATA